MKLMRMKLVGVFSTSVLAACGGGGDGNQAPAVQYERVVSFGDSLSDVGTYNVSGVASLGGGKYTVNGASAKNWTELISAQLGVAAPCAAQTGLEGTGIYVSSSLVLPLTATQTDHAGCYNYAQGGARVTAPYGPGNRNLGGANVVLGQLTVPVQQQIANHLAAAGGFTSRDLVTVMAGGNDIFINAGLVSASAMTPTDAVTNMGQAGAELASYVRTQIVANGATHVLVANLVDVSKSPYVYAISDATLRAQTAALIQQMVTAFNQQLAAGLATTNGVLLVDTYTASQEQAANPTKYGLSNATEPACIVNNTSANPLSSSLVCSSANVIGGDISTYLFADTVHPTPYGYKLLAQLIAQKLVARGWL